MKANFSIILPKKNPISIKIVRSVQLLYNSPENQDVRGRLEVNNKGGSRILEGGSSVGLGTEVPQRDPGTNPERGFDNIVRRSWLYFCKLY